MTRKEQIVDLARKAFPLYHNKLPEYEQKFKDFADAILALPIEVPSEEEIKESSQYYIEKHTIDRPMQWTYIDGYEDAISEIIKRNKK